MSEMDLGRTPTTLQEARSMLDELKGELLTLQGELANKGIEADGFYQQSYAEFQARRSELVKRQNLLTRKIVELKALVKRLDSDEWRSDAPTERAMRLLRKLFHEVELDANERRTVADFTNWVKEQRRAP